MDSAAKLHVKTAAPGAHGVWNMIRSLIKFAAGILALWALLGWCVWQWVQSQPDDEDAGTATERVTVKEQTGKEK